MNAATVDSRRDFPSVSVVTPTRDRPEFLRRALAAVFAQTYAGEIECVVVFDQSEPRLPDLSTPDGKMLRAIVNERSPGLAGARNSGALAASGELVAFCDDDDEWLPEKLAFQVAAMRALAATTVSCGIVVRYRGREVERRPASDTVTFDDLLRSRRMEIHPSTILVSREALLGRIGLVDEGIPGSYAEDYEWLLRAARAGVLAAVPRPLVRVQWHESSFFTARWDTIISALTYLLDKYPEFERVPAGLARIYGQLAFAHAASGRRAEARRWARRSLKLNPRQPRAYLALLVSSRVVRPDTVLRVAHTFGRGV
ncbi:MAG: glycosyltransferase [Actinomycetota bacterium]|nr:glycosyltransferase [Actinomycetota bacterium]